MTYNSQKQTLQAHNEVKLITTIKVFIVQATGANVIKLFTAVSYDFS
jgi:hypothetical protein